MLRAEEVFLQSKFSMLLGFSTLKRNFLCPLWLTSYLLLNTESIAEKL